MQKIVHAIFEDGILRPLEPLTLPDKSSVLVTIEPDDVSAFFTEAELADAKADTVTLAEVRAALSSIQGSLSDAVIQSRDDR